MTANASFQLENYRIIDLEVHSSNSLNMSLGLTFDLKGEFDENNRIFNLTFKLDINSEDSNYLLAKIVMESNFKFATHVTLDKIPDYFYTNSIAIIFPYLRAYLSMVTIQGNFKPIILPILNLSSLNNVLKNNTSKKEN